MLRSFALLALTGLTLTLGACASHCGDRSTAAAEEKIEVYKPIGKADRGEIH
jgi:hypothetical protein